MLACIFGLMLAGALAAQSTGIALSRKAPDLALTMFPLNGLAREKLASLIFLSSAAESGKPELGAQEAASQALASYRNEPLTPEAHAILAFANGDAGTRSEMVGLASNLNRREPRLQALVLQEEVAARDYAGAIETLDRILRVRPSRSDELFPTLLSVFVQEGAVQEFARILDGTSPWHEAFFGYAVDQPAALPNLVELRSRVSFNDQELDQKLLRKLAEQGDLKSAFLLYDRIAEPGEAHSGNRVLDWSNTYTPIEWSLVDRGALRAQPNLAGDKLEIDARPGNGGVVARRFIKAPKAPFKVAVKHKIAPGQGSEDIDIGLRCAEEGAPVFNVNLQEMGDGHEVASLPSTCAFIELTIAARAWSGRSALRAEIDSIRIER